MTRSLAILLPMIGLVACEADPADVLDAPRVLAIQAVPPTVVEGDDQVITALAFGLADADMRWQACDAPWDAGETITCSTGSALDLGAGNPIVFTAPSSSAWWLHLSTADGAILPAVRKLATSGSATNPIVDALTIDGVAPTTGLQREATVELGVAVTTDADVNLGVTWYTTAGEILPARTRVDETATLTAPSEPGRITVIAVVRDDGGGVGWRSLTLDVGP